MSDDRTAPVQSERGSHRRSSGIPAGIIDWSEHLEVYGRYADLYGTDQSAERIAERGGFGVFEAEALLGRPLRTWRPRSPR